MRRVGLIILGVLVLWLCACSSQNLAGAGTGQTALPHNQPATQTAIIPTPGLVNNAIVTATRLPTLTPTATLVPSPTPTITHTPVGFEYIRQCLPIQDYVPEDFELSGTLIIEQADILHAVDMNEQNFRDEIIFIPELDMQVLVVSSSPDHQKLAIYMRAEGVSGDLINRYIIIVDGEGHVVAPLYRLGEWRFDKWRDNELINIRRSMENGSKYAGIYNPNTQAITETLLPPLDGPYQGDNISLGPWYDYDRSYALVVFQGDNGKYRLFEVETNKMFWERKIGSPWPFLGVGWSTDYQEYAVAVELGSGEESKAELFIVNRGGIETQMTNLGNVFPDQYISLASFDWSPDGRFIAFWMSIREGKFAELWSFAVLEVETGVLTEYCFPDEFFSAASSYWSPDSRQVAFSTFSQDGTSAGQPIVLDLTTNMAVRLPNNGVIQSWMK